MSRAACSTEVTSLILSTFNKSSEVMVATWPPQALQRYRGKIAQESGVHVAKSMHVPALRHAGPKLRRGRQAVALDDGDMLKVIGEHLKEKAQACPSVHGMAMKAFRSGRQDTVYLCA
jgi:hypothetical protein